MKYAILIAAVLAAISPVFTLDGQIGIHDPSSIGVSDGKYFAFGTGGNGIMSDDGWTWRSGAVRPNGGVAPDVCKIGDRYLVSYGGVATMWTKSLDPNSPDFGFSQPIQIARSEGSELNAIDSSLLLAPDGRLWMTMGSYVGYIRLYELDPKTGGKLNDQYANIAINCEATEMIYHDGWYYLFGNKASCCSGPSSGYNIRMGRSKNPTGPFIDNMGHDMLQGGGKLFASSTGRWIGPGHFGLLDLGDGVQKWSCHYEADLDRGGQSVLDIRPLWYKDGWPVAGFNILKETTYRIDSGGIYLAPGGGGVAGGGKEWTISPVTNAGGYPGSPFLKITIPGTNRALAISPTKELVTLAEFSGAPEQLWRLDQLVDGTWRIMPKTLSGAKDGLALTASGGATSLAKFDFKNKGQHWSFTVPGDPKVLKEGTYEIESARTGRALELAVEGVPVGGGRGGRGMGFGRGGGAPIPDQDASQVSAGWPTGNIDARLANYMCQAQQKWTIQPAAADSGSLYKIVIAGSDRALAATADRDVITVPLFTGSSEQLWRFGKLDDGTWRITPKSIPNVQEELSLSSIGTGGVTLTKFDPKSDKQRWNVIAP
jgi:arabinan endo-1,5-alpha-L-arabinosidase